MSADDTLARVRKVLEDQPFSVLLGTRVIECGDGIAVLALELERHHLQQHGFAHGGVLSYLADNALTIAGGLAMKSDALTSEFKINYLRPAVGQSLVVRAQSKSAGKRQSVCVCEVFSVDDGGEKLCAVAQGTIVAV